MIAPQTVTSVEQFIGAVRDLIFVFGIGIGLPVFGWKARSWVQPGIDFFKRWNAHMDYMETGMNQLLGNHMSHMQADLKKLAEKDDARHV